MGETGQDGAVDRDLEEQVRLAAFAFIADLQETHGTSAPRAELARGFVFSGHRVPLVGPSGIFKPALLELPLSVTTKPVVAGQPRPYDDTWIEGGLIAYRYRGTDPGHYQNVGLRAVMTERLPVVYLFGIVPGWYAPAFPAYIVGDDPRSLTFTIAVDDYLVDTGEEPFVEDPAPRRAYVTRQVRHRLHQEAFRHRVVRAYHEQCAVCRLRRRELIDAAHILPDRHPKSEPIVPNGLAMCRLHHAAFDRDIIGIRPDLVVELRQDVLDEVDGPMLVHGLQGFQGAKLLVPRSQQLRPNPAFLEERYEGFRRAG